MDELCLEFSDISLQRSHGDSHTCTTILEPVSFEMEVARNMNGAVNEADPPDIKAGFIQTIFKCNNYMTNI